MWSAGTRSTSNPSTSTSFSIRRGPMSVPDTDTTEPSGSVPRTVSRLRWSGLSSLVVSTTSTPRSLASSGAFTYDTGSSTTSVNTPLSAASSSTDTSCAVISPRTSTSSRVATPPASAVKMRPSRSASGSPGRTSSAIDAALHVDRVRDQLAGERQADRTGDRDARLLLRLVGAGPQVRGGDDGVQREQRAVRARLLGVDVQARAGDPAVLRARAAARPRRRCHRARR